MIHINHSKKKHKHQPNNSYIIGIIQGWTQDVKDRDRDAGFTSRDETKTRRANFDMILRRDVCSSQDIKAGLDIVVTAVLKIIFLCSLGVGVL